MMLQKICIYNNKIFTIFDTYLVAYSVKTYFESQNERFNEYLKIKIPVKCVYLNEIALEVVNHYVTGLRCLVVLVFDLKGLSNAFIYCDSFKKILYEIVLPIGPVTIEDYCNRMFVSDGPMFLFHSNDGINIFSVAHRKIDFFDSSFACPDSKECKILQFKSFGPFKVINSLIYLSLLISYDFASGQSIKVVGFVSDTKNPAVNCEQLSLHLFFPPYYETVLKAVEIIKVLPVFKSNSINLKDVEWKESISIICTKDECLVFFNAVLMYCCKLTIPISEVMWIKSEFSSSFSENMHIILTLENKTVLFIAVKEDNTCKVVKYWTGIKATLTGNILKNGSKQVLLLKQTDLEVWQNSCILYDMLSFIPIDMLHQNAMSDECLKTTISGLERKVQVGKSLFKEVEHEISEKSAATINALIKLNEFKVNNECLKHSKIFQESLIDLILSKDENKPSSIPPESEQSVKFLELERRFIDNHWVLRLFFKNERETSICNPSIKVLMEDNQIMCLQKLFVCNSNNFSFSDKNSWHINPKGRFIILLSFEFSFFHTEDIFLILTWYNGSAEEFDNEIFIKEDRKVLVQHQLCLQTGINLSDIVKYQEKTDVLCPNDILFLRASRQKIKLFISSLHSSISRLDDILISKDFNFRNLHLFRSSSIKCIAFRSEKSVLFGVHIVFQTLEQNAIEIEAYTRNEMESLLLIQFLYEHLPEDIIIYPHLNSKDEFLQIRRQAANSMKSELDLLISSLSIYNVSEEMRKNYSKLSSSQMAGSITIAKTTYNRIRTILVKKEYITDSALKYINF